jgi:hypothetical protein
MKKSLKKSIFLIFLGVFLFSLANAQEVSYFKDDFERYSLGELPISDDCDSTSTNYCRIQTYYSIPLVVNSYSHSPTKSLTAPLNSTYGVGIATTPSVFTTSTEGRVSVWVRHQKRDGLYFRFHAANYTRTDKTNCGMKAEGDNYYYLTEDTGHNPKWIPFASSTNGVWDYLTIEFKQYENLIYCKYYLNNNAVSDWVLSFNSHRENVIKRVLLFFNNSSANGQSWVDDLEIGRKYDIEHRDFNTAGWIDENFFVDILDTIKQFDPPYPNRPYYIVPTSTDIFLKATFINLSTLNLYKPTKLIFYSRTSGEENTIDLNLPWLGLGSTSTNINITQLRDFFANQEDILEMKLEIQRRNLLTAGMWVVDTFYFPLPTAPPIFLALKENPEQLIIIQEGRLKPPKREDYLVPLADCSQAQNLLEMVSCEIRNLLIEVFVPKKKSLEMLENQMNILSNKFPFNVFLTIKNFFGEVVNSLQGEAKVKMFRKEVVLSENFYNSIPVISTLYQGIRLLFNLFVVFMFIKVLKLEVEVLIHSIT